MLMRVALVSFTYVAFSPAISGLTTTLHRAATVRYCRMMLRTSGGGPARLQPFPVTIGSHSNQLMNERISRR